MDEEQALESPIAGGIRGIRRTVSSSIFAGRRAPEQVQPDSITTNLLQQNSLSLNNVSGQLTNISSQVAGLNGSLLAIKDNLSLSDTLERQRETARQNREAILAEQGLREGKESQIESRIQNALTFPVRRLAQKTQFALSRLTNFFLILAGGWLTNTVINLIRATSDGNIDLMNQLKTALTRALVVAGGTLLALSLGFKRIIQGIGFLGTTAFRIGRGAFLRKPFLAVTATLAAGLTSVIPSTGNQALDIGLGAAIFGGLGLTFEFVKNQFKKFLPFLDEAGGKGTAKVVTKELGKQAVQGAGGKGFMGLLRKLALPLRGKGGAIGTFLIDFLLFGTPIDEALAGAAGFFAGVKAGAALGGTLGAFVGGIGAGPGALIGGLIGGFFGTDIFKNIYKGLKTMFGFKTSDDQQGMNEEQEAELAPALFNRGGKVRGPSVNRDIVPAMLTPGEFVMTKGTTERIGASFFESLNKGGMVDKSITPINKMSLNNVAEKVSSLEEGAPEIINFPVPNMMQSGNGDSGGGGQSSSTRTNDIPFIGFDNNNPHTLFATSRYGANA